MPAKPKVIVDPHFRTMDEVFSPDDRRRLHDLANVVWGEDAPMPEDQFLQHLPDAEVIICADWRYGEVLHLAKNLRAVLVISGAFPLHLDYDYCYQHKIRVMSVAPALAKCRTRVITTLRDKQSEVILAKIVALV